MSSWGNDVSVHIVAAHVIKHGSHHEMRPSARRRKLPYLPLEYLPAEEHGKKKQRQQLFMRRRRRQVGCRFHLGAFRAGALLPPNPKSSFHSLQCRVPKSTFPRPHKHKDPTNYAFWNPPLVLALRTQNGGLWAPAMQSQVEVHKIEYIEKVVEVPQIIYEVCGTSWSSQIFL